jgi:choline dehydrogenase-like flavoprotein
MIYVIGSGPSGISAAIPLLKKGYKVTMLDPGLELEKERTEAVKRLRGLNKDQWDEESISLVKENMTGNVSGVDQKYIYGSNYPYFGIDRYQPIKLKNAKMVRSLAKGGFSNVWGAGIFPVLKRDITDWPFSYEELKKNYQSVLSFMPHAGVADESGNEAEIYGADCQGFKTCAQTLSFLTDLKKNAKRLEEEGISFHLPRLAVNFNKQNDEPGCTYCGLCLYGCPYGLVYSSAFTVSKLEDDKNFNYVRDVLVERIEERNGEVKIFASRISNSEKISFTGTRAFLAGGPVSSARILLRSLEAYDRHLVIKHSDQFQIPLIRYKSIKDVVKEELHTLNQLSIRIFDENICKNTIMLSMFAYNDLYSQVLKRMAGPLEPFLRVAIAGMLGRLLMFKGYLHSDVSSNITAMLEKGDEGALILEGHPNPEAKKIVKQVTAKMTRNRKYLRGFPMYMMIGLGLPGAGNHSGSSFPMKEKPYGFESDLLGRPYGFERLHVVDATVLPSIPATTITFTIMANAYRIAGEC